MRVYCPDCDTPRTVPENWVGRRVRCRECDRPFRVGTLNKRSAPAVIEDDIDPDRQRTAAWVVGSAVLLVVGLIVGVGLTGWFFLKAHAPACDVEEMDGTDPGDFGPPPRPAHEPPEFDPLPEDPE